MKHLAAMCLLAASVLAQSPRQPQRNNRRPAPQITETGMVRRVSPKQIIIESADHRIIWYRIASDIGLDRGKARPGDQIAITSTSDDAGRYIATHVEGTRAGTAED